MLDSIARGLENSSKVSCIGCARRLNVDKSYLYSAFNLGFYPGLLSGTYVTVAVWQPFLGRNALLHVCKLRLVGHVCQLLRFITWPQA